MEEEQVQQNTPAQQPVPETTTEQPEPQKSSRIPTVILVVITVLSLCLSGYLAYQNNQLRKQQELPKPTQKPATIPPTPKINSTDKWEVYESIKYNYEIKYPVNVIVTEGPGSKERVQESHFELRGPGYLQDTERNDGFIITIAVLNNQSNKKPMDFAQEIYQGAKDILEEDILEGDINKCKIENTTRDGVEGVKFYHCVESPGSGIVSFGEWYTFEGNTYEISGLLQNEQYEDIFNQVLSTFTFAQLQ